MPRRPPRPRVTPKQLKYYRGRFRDAIREDGVVCLECGRLFRDLKFHLRLKHALHAEAYREKWGYNRTTPLIIPAIREAHRQHALAAKLGAFSTRERVQKAIAAIPRRRPPIRAETRLAMRDRMRARVAAGWRPPVRQKVDDEMLRALVRHGLTRRQIAERMGLPRSTIWQRITRLGLAGPAVAPFKLKATNEELLALRRAGLWRSEIAARTGMRPDAVQARLQRLRGSGLPVRTSDRPRPNSMRKASDIAILAGVRAGLGPSRLAPRLGLSVSALEKRLARLRRRGLLRPGRRPRTMTVPDAEVLELRRAGLGNREIAARTGLRPETVGDRFWRLRRRGVAVPSPAGRGSVRRVHDEAILALARTGLSAAKIAVRVGLRLRTLQDRLTSLRRRGLLPRAPRPVVVSDDVILRLRREGLWPHQMAARTGMAPRAIGWRLRKLRRQGVTVPRPPGPRPSGRRRATDEQLLSLAQAGLRTKEIAARLAIARVTVGSRLRALRRRGVLPPLPPIRDPGELLALRRAGLRNREIAARMGLTVNRVEYDLRRLRRRGVAVAPVSRSRVSDEDLLALMQTGRGPSEIAARVGLSRGQVFERLQRLRERGLLPERPGRTQRRFTDDELLVALQAGQRTGDIARRLGVTPAAVKTRVRRLRRRGLLPPAGPSPSQPSNPPAST